jgi:hypothetical protein
MKKEQLLIIPDSNEIDCTFSNKFERRMNRLIISQKKSYWKYINTASKKVAIVILACIVAFSSAMTVEGIRKPVLDFFYRIYETFTDISYYNEKQEPGEPISSIYTLPCVPEGYDFKEFINMDYVIVTSWMNDKGEKIEFTQSELNSETTIDSEGVVVTTKEINETGILFCDNGEVILITWKDNTYAYLLSYPSYIGERYAEDIVGKLVLKGQ